MRSVKLISIVSLVFLVVAVASCGGVEISGHPIFGKTMSDGGAVVVDLTPERFADGKLTVAIRVTTHTVNDLDRHDLRQITLLKASGVTAAPISAPQMQGHHNQGSLVFELSELPASFQIEIRGLPGKELMRFQWP